MPYDARVIQVLIASPGDVITERAVAAEVIFEWNSVNARDRRVVLVPLRWEMDATPEMGDRTQAIINRQIVDQCDLVVGMFWTRLGTPTDEAESGTAEELDRVGRAGKPIMLYFSKVPVDLETVDLDEYHRLDEFKTRTYPNGLIEKYESVTQFREKFARHLASRVIKLIASDPSDDDQARPPAVQLRLAFASSEPLRVVDDSNPFKLTRIVCSNDSDIPDYPATDEMQSPSSGAEDTTWDRLMVTNPDYYRELVRYHADRSAISQFRLAVINNGETAVHDIQVGDEPRSSCFAGRSGYRVRCTLAMPHHHSLAPRRQ